MERGKQICRILKDIRVKIAQENDIEFITSECTHKGDCAGTCPKCEAEVRYLESQLARRHASGRQMRLAGISLGIAAIAPALASCEPLTTAGDPLPPQIDGDIAHPNNVQLGENLIFDLIRYDSFMQAFAGGEWVEAEIYDVYPNGSLGEELLGRIEDYSPIRFAVEGDKLKYYYRSYDEQQDLEYELLDFTYDEWTNHLNIGNIHSFTVASIDENEMVCYGPVFSQQWAPEAFLGKYVFRRIDEDE